MVFSSLLFLLRFFPAALLLYYVVPGRFRNFVLFAVSLFFYAWGEPVYVCLILFSTLIDYTAGRAVGYYKAQGKMRAAKAGVVVSAVTNLGLLGTFKYTDFFLSTVNEWMQMDFVLPHLALPIGISFYTFQTMSYTIDVYRGDADVQKNFITFGTYVSLFPQLIAGPIIRYKTVEKQLTWRKESVELFADGIFRFTIGLGKKVLIANQIGELWNEIASTNVLMLSTMEAWLGAVAFTLQIYFDFSGYSDMAIGLGKMFGFEFPENFEHPYESKSITEFWRRWHISLGTWFREYVYIPLGGNRRGFGRQIFNIAVVWFLTGLWHGAAWNFIIWGVYYGVFLILEKLFFKNAQRKVPENLGRVYTLVIVTIGWVIFSWQDLSDSSGFMKTMFFFRDSLLFRTHGIYLLCNYAVLLCVAAVGATTLPQKICNRVFPANTVRREIVAMVFFAFVFVMTLACLVNSSYNPFLYFRF